MRVDRDAYANASDIRVRRKLRRIGKTIVTRRAGSHSEYRHNLGSARLKNKERNRL
jgi:hypothetical protein